MYAHVHSELRVGGGVSFAEAALVIALQPRQRKCFSWESIPGERETHPVILILGARSPQTAGE